MPKLPAVEGSRFIKFLEAFGFKILRTKGSHTRLIADDGRMTTVPIHKGKILPKGLLRKIIREDLELDFDEFMSLWEKHFK